LLHGPAINRTVWRGFRLQREGKARSRKFKQNLELRVMKLTTLAAALAAMFVFVHSAQAREHHRHHVMHRQAGSSAEAQPAANFFGQPNPFAGPSVASGHLGGRPSAWCGWEMRQLVGADPGPAFNLARSWARWGQPGPVGVGAVVVWSHHVGKIVGQQDGQWVIQSGNDGHAVRTRPRTLAGVIAIRWG
jgi:hypothetical protein